MRVPVDPLVNPRQVDSADVRHRQRVNFSAADNEGRWIGRRQSDGFLDRMSNFRPREFKTGLPREDDRRPARQATSDGFERFAAHDQMVPHRKALEPFEILRNVPR